MGVRGVGAKVAESGWLGLGLGLGARARARAGGSGGLRFHFYILKEISLEFVDFRADFYRNFTKSCTINENSRIFAENCENCENCEI